MALVKCPECGKDVSDQAEICINCGFKIAGTDNLHEMSEKKEAEIRERQNSKRRSIIVTIIVVVIIVILGVTTWYRVTEPERARRRLQESIDRFQESSDRIEELERQLE